MSVHRVSRRSFLQSVAGAAVAAPFLIPRHPRRPDRPPRQHRRVGPGVLRHHVVRQAPGVRAGGRGRRRPVPSIEVLEKFPEGPRLPGLARAAEEGARPHRLGQRLDARSHALPRRDGGDEAQGKPVYVQKPLCNTLREMRLLTEVGAQARPDVADGHPGVVIEGRSATAKRSCAAASSARSRKSTRSRTRAGATTSRWPSASIRCRRRSTGISGSASREARPFKRGVYHPGEWRRRVGFGTGTLGDMGCHIYSPPYRALKLTSPISGHGATGPAPRPEKLGHEGAKVQADLPRHRVHRGQHGRRVVVRRRRAAARRDPASRSARACPTRAASSSAPTGLLVLPHGERTSVRAAGLEDGANLPKIDLRRARSLCASSSRRCWRAARTQCSASFDYAGPLTESVLIGNVAAHFPGETLAFDGKALQFPNKPEANQYLTRSYRKGWTIRT